MRVRLFPLVWRVLWPVRAYLTLSPLSRGKGAIVRWLVVPFLPPMPAAFETTLPGGARVVLRYREVIGLATLLNGPFEYGEIMLARALVVPGTTAIDVGANVGVFTLPLADAVGQNGEVVALEPSHENAERLRRHLEANRVSNVDVLELAAGREPGLCSLYLASDPAFHSTTAPPARRATSEVAEVEATTLDAIWRARGRPHVSLLKVDVEGAELEVLRGANELLETDGPSVFVESNTARELEAVATWLGGLGYDRRRAPELQRWNYVFRRRGS